MSLRTLKVCQTPSKLKAAAPFLVKIGEEEAKAGWVKVLRDGKNPCTKEELEKLRN